MIQSLFLVALGGAIGASLRWLVGLWILRFGQTAVPLPVLSVNVLGSFLMGLCVILLTRNGTTPASLFLMTGVLGGFTTFSAFSLEALTLIERGQIVPASAYIIGSVLLSIMGLAFGVWLARGIVS